MVSASFNCGNSLKKYEYLMYAQAVPEIRTQRPATGSRHENKSPEEIQGVKVQFS